MLMLYDALPCRRPAERGHEEHQVAVAERRAPLPAALLLRARRHRVARRPRPGRGRGTLFTTNYDNIIIMMIPIHVILSYCRVAEVKK